MVASRSSNKFGSEGRVLFQPNSLGQQFQSWYDDDMPAVRDLKSAVNGKLYSETHTIFFFFFGNSLTIVIE